jgi:hypothetical protein
MERFNDIGWNMQSISKVLNQVTYGINNREVIQTNYPFAIINKSDISISYNYKINLPSDSDINNKNISFHDYVYTIQLDGKFTEFDLDGSGNPITNDIYTANSYFYNTHFVHDSTWNPRILPPILKNDPYKIKCYNTELDKITFPKSIIEIFNDPIDPFFINIKITLLPKMYLVGTFEITYGDIYPADLTDFYEYFRFTIVKTKN